jgi:Tfp pilus assembly protein PilV
MKNRFSPEFHYHGFSLIDVLIAIVVLATAFLALTVLQGTLTRNAADSRARAQIAAYTEGLIDQLRASGYANIVAGTVSASSGTPAQRAMAASIQNITGISTLSAQIVVDRYYGSGSHFTTSAPSVIDDTTPEYKEVNVIATWTDGAGQSRNFKLSTIISPTSINQDNILVTQTPLTTSSTMNPIAHKQ